MLEQKYADFSGLNLTFETREGILKHCSANNARELGDIGQRFLDRTQPSLEAQIANIADAIAYNNHDVDDGYRAGLLSVDELRDQPLFASGFDAVSENYPQLEDRRLIYEIIRRMIDRVVTDLIETTRRNIESADPASIDEVRNQARPMVALSDAVLSEHQSLKRFLFQNLYQHEKVLEMTQRAQHMLELLFDAYMRDPRQMSDEFSAPARSGDEAGKARIVADYIAGMTDRFAIAEHERLG